MSRVKVIQKTQGQIDFKIFTKRSVPIVYDEVNDFITKTPIRLVLCSASEQVRARVIPNSSDPTLPIVGYGMEYMWYGQLPEFISDICDQVRAVFSLKSEVEGFRVTVYTPASSINHRNNTMVSRVSPDQMMKIGSRIIIPCGTSEMINVTVSAGSKKQSGNGDIRLLDGQGLMTPLGVSAAADFSWHDGSYAKEAQRPGFRETNFKKNPLHRYVFVIDCMTNITALFQAVKDEAKTISKGDEGQAEKLAEQMKSILSPSEVVPPQVEETPSSDSLKESTPSVGADFEVITN